METTRHVGKTENPWGVLVLLALGLMISLVDRTSLSSALANKGFIRHFALTDVDRGWLNAAFFWSYGVLRMPMGWLVDRYGVKWPYAACFLLWCLLAAATAAVTTVSALILMMDPALGAPIAAWMIVNASWPVMFVATGLVGLVWLAPWLLRVRNDHPRKPQLEARVRNASAVPLSNLLASPVVWGGLINNFCYADFGPDFSSDSPRCWAPRVNAVARPDSEPPEVSPRGAALNAGGRVIGRNGGQGRDR